MIGLVAELGGAVRAGAKLVRAGVRADWLDWVRGLESFGFGSIAVAALTAAFTGGMLVVQAGLYVKELGASTLVGWGTGYTMFREVGPVLLALVYAGRVGSRNAAELAAMGTTEQLTALRALGVDPLRAIAAPRAAALVVSLVALTFVADAVAMIGGAIAAQALLGVTAGEFLRSAQEHLTMADVWNGVAKSAVFGVIIAIVSTREGLRAQAGAMSVGNAASRCVTRSAMTIIVIDLFLTAVLP